MGEVMPFPSQHSALARDELLEIMRVKEELSRLKLLIDLLSDQIKNGVQPADLFIARSSLKNAYTQLCVMSQRLNTLANRYIQNYQ